MSSSAVSSLFQPLVLGSTTVRNRIAMSALTRNRAIDTVSTDLMVEYYTQRARGGAGLIVTEGILVSRQGTEWQHAPGLWDRELHVPGWKKIVDAVHKEGTKIYAQLWHVGRLSHPDSPQQKLSGEPVWGPSAIAARGGKFRYIENAPGYQEPTAIPDPTKIIEEYRHAAVLAKEAGFDGVELHYANGYLPAQFIDSTSNKRTDQWGGSVENRARFGLEVLRAMKESFPNDTSMKIMPGGGYNDVGMPLEETQETFTYLINEAEKIGLSYITLVRYTAWSDVEFDGKKRGTPHDIVGTYGPLIKKAKILVNSGVQPEEGAELVQSGRVDVVSIGFNWATHPDVANRIQHGKPLDNIPNIPHLQLGEDGDLSVGYTDYPEATY
ncbi:flavoprotein NADH-dependent oxidoreductase [Flagelloscypha sp. PMI_526]|nr:flavoprotein NADH-dependent oxidoreductase [Flagelloscypha sp. PMI_526]